MLARKQAETFKAEGNEYYKKREFEKALELYQSAVDLVPDELTYYSNKAAVFFEMKEYAICVEECDLAIE